MSQELLAVRQNNCRSLFLTLEDCRARQLSTL
jgi:hypothetical protein